ncbi:MAG: ATP-dependent DNA helicase RecG [Fibrobacter sp.]|jgi:ATP-dependent DNA helicase RecG|nr:ATP-dependent DNA helicase RecG [Fibrobacter sp.]
MDLKQLPGLGPKRIQLLQKAGFNSVQDLLFFIPRTWLDHTTVQKINELQVQDKAILVGTIQRAGVVRARTPFFQATIADSTGEITLTFFRNPSYWSKRIQVGMRCVVIGVVSAYRGLQLVHPDIQVLSEDAEFKGRIVPVYSISESWKEARMDQRFFLKLFEHIFKLANLSVSNSCPTPLCEFLGLNSVLENLRRLHRPHSFQELYAAKRQLKILELLPFCLRMVVRRQRLQDKGMPRSINQDLLTRVETSLDYKLTHDQSQALHQILKGLSEKRQFHALLQGDVGSGKTVVAMLAMFAVCGAQEQCALMVPTDILARQHYEFLKPYFEAQGLRISLLLGANTAAEKRSILGELQMGLSHAVVGTHALFSKAVVFQNLGCVIIDEQHRFGVQQREALLAKGNNPDLLVMSATPIPRSLAMTLYGDLETIIIREKPPGRKPVKTRIITPQKREELKKFVSDEAKKGHQSYWVINRIDAQLEEEKLSIAQVLEELQSFDPAWKIKEVHGQMPEAEREENLKLFNEASIHTLVATTVIEVGVNVPNANIMIIDEPERFGLSQLHQLRGRVGRGNQQAWCFLVAGTENPAWERLKAFASTEDGFEIAEMDLQERGAGNLEGSKQSGSWVLRWFDWVKDHDLIQDVLKWSESILKELSNFDASTRQKIQEWYQEAPLENYDGIH